MSNGADLLAYTGIAAEMERAGVYALGYFYA